MDSTAVITPVDSAVQWDRIFDLIDELKDLSEADAAEKLRLLEQSGESADIINKVRIHLRMPVVHHEILPATMVGGEYRITGRLGSGGMGIVYEAVLEKAGQTVALKMIHPDLILADSRQRFIREMKALGQLDHPGIVGIRHAGSHVISAAGGETSEFFTMERIPGTGLHEYLKQTGANLAERLRIVRDVAIAVAYAHDRQIIHRDLKPGNMIIRTDGRAMIFDFGLAAAVYAKADESAPQRAEGTPPYLAPEQAAGAPPSPAADIYSLGAILYEILSGEPLYRFHQLAGHTAKIEAIRNPPPRPRLASADASQALEAILDKALALAPEDRFPSAAAFARALNRLLPAHLVNEPPHKWHPAAGVAVPATDWVLEEKLGDGAHGQVWFASNRPVLTSSEAPLIPPPRVYKFCATDDAARSLRREQRVFQALKRASDSLAPARLAPSAQHPEHQAAADPTNAPAAPAEIPGIVPLEAWSLDEPPYYIAMRWIEGSCDLREWIESKKHPLLPNLHPLQESPPAEPAESSEATHATHAAQVAQATHATEAAAISIVCTVAGALQFASQNGVIHRDVSPANILVREDPSAPGGVRAWLIDFGLSDFDPTFAKSLLTTSITDSQTRIVGAPEYIAPELKRGNPATTQSDLYSLGVVLFRLLRQDLTATLTEWKQHITDPFLREDLTRCLADHPTERFPSASALAISLQNLPNRRSVASEASRQAKAAEHKRLEELASAKKTAYRRGVAISSVVAFVIVAAASWLVWFAQDRASAAKRAQSLSRSRAFTSALGQISSLSRRNGPGRIEEATRLAAGANPQDQTEQAALSEEFARILELDDWESRTEKLRATGVVRHCHKNGDLFIETRQGKELCAVHRDGTLAWREAILSEPVSSLSPDGRFAAFAEGKNVRVKSTSNSPPMWSHAAEQEIRAITWSPDSRKIALGMATEERGRIEILTIDGMAPAVLMERNSAPFCRPSGGMAFSPDGTLLAQWSPDSLNLLIWETGTGQLRTSAFHPAPVRNAVWSAEHLISAAGNGFLYLWKLSDVMLATQSFRELDRPAFRLPLALSGTTGHYCQWVRLAMTCQSTVLAAADEQGAVTCFDHRSGAVVAETPAGTPVSELYTETHGIFILRTDGTTERLSRKASSVFRSFRGPGASAVDDFDISPDGTSVAVASAAGLELHRPTASLTLSRPSAFCRGVRFDGISSFVYSDRFSDGQCEIVGDALTSRKNSAWPLMGEMHNRPARLAAAPEAGALVIARFGGIDWACGKGKERLRIPLADQSSPMTVSISPDGSMIGWTENGASAWLAVWNNGKPAVHRLPTPGHAVTLGGKLCASSSPGGPKFYALPSLQSVEIRNLPAGLADDCALAPDSGLAAVALSSGGVEVGRIEDRGGLQWSPVVRLGTTQPGIFSRLRFCAAGRSLGGVSRDGTLAVWDVAVLLDTFQRCGCLAVK